MDNFVIRRNIKSQKIIKPVKFKKLRKLKKKLHQKLKKKSQKSMFIQMVRVLIMENPMPAQALVFGLAKTIPGITMNLLQVHKQIIERNYLLLLVLYLF